MLFMVFLKCILSLLDVKNKFFFEYFELTVSIINIFYERDDWIDDLHAIRIMMFNNRSKYFIDRPNPNYVI
jgi:hypothetical protein